MRAGARRDRTPAAQGQPGEPPVIQSIMYTNPDGIPPAINETRLLADAGYVVKFLCREYKRTWGIDYPQTAQIVRISSRYHGSWQEFFSFVVETFRRVDRSAAVVIGHDMHGFLAARLVSAWLRRPLIYRCHDFVERGAQLGSGGTVARAFEQRFARTADLVIVPDADRAEVIARALRLRRPPLVVANSPIRRPAGSGEALRRDLQLRGIHFDRIVLRQGRIGTGHSIEATIRSIPMWSEGTWGFVLLGPGDGDYREMLEDLARSLGVEERVVVLPPVAYDRIGDYTSGADVGHALYDPIHVNHVHFATASNKIMEYLASGLPLLTSDTPALRSLVETYRCGVIADQHDPSSIAAGVNALLADPQRAAQLGANGALAFEQVFAYERQFAPALAAIQALCHAA